MWRVVCVVLGRVASKESGPGALRGAGRDYAVGVSAGTGLRQLGGGPPVRDSCFACLPVSYFDYQYVILKYIDH